MSLSDCNVMEAERIGRRIDQLDAFIVENQSRLWKAQDERDEVAMILCASNDKDLRRLKADAEVAFVSLYARKEV